MPGERQIRCAFLLFLLAAALSSFATIIPPAAGQASSSDLSVKLEPIRVDPKRPERRDFGALRLAAAFHLQSSDQRFGGLSGAAIGADGRLYAVSDRGYWLSARMVSEENGALTNLVDWQIGPLLGPDKNPVTGGLRDAEALAQTGDGSLLVGFEGAHRIWRYRAPPDTFTSAGVPIPIPTAAARAPSNGGIEGLATLPDGRLLILTEQFENPDGSVKGWLSEHDKWTELSYVPAPGFRVTDCAALDSGDVLVLERRYVPFGILSVRLTRVRGKDIRANAKLAGKELMKLEQPLAAENFEALAVRQTSSGTAIFLLSDNNFSLFQQTLLLQFFLPNGDS
jgi:hypothetical protein